jgi:ABC-type multidrug transport system ATPase subunit
MSTIASEHTPEHGSVAIDGRVIGPDDRSTDHMFERCNVSWCPQEDALFPQLSVEQHLEFYARMRGLNWGSDAASQHIEAIVRLLGLSKHATKLSTELSGGYKRRLSLAIAMIGYPTSMLVDECTTGVDPGARHLIWGVLQPDLISETYSLPAILLSTHYMDEAAKLASRIGIMINGEMVVSGSLDRLQERYCGSYFIEIALDEDAADSVEEDTVSAFKSKGMEATIYESIPFNFKLQVPFLHESEANDSSRIQQLISIFGLLETKKSELRIKFYSVAQMNLEQIFIDLSRQQFDEDESLRDVTTSRRQSQRLAQ